MKRNLFLLHLTQRASLFAHDVYAEHGENAAALLLVVAFSVQPLLSADGISSPGLGDPAILSSISTLVEQLTVKYSSPDVMPTAVTHQWRRIRPNWDLTRDAQIDNSEGIINVMKLVMYHLSQKAMQRFMWRHRRSGCQCASDRDRIVSTCRLIFLSG